MLRNSAIDNIKLAMILLVVFGHLVEPVIKNSEYIKTIYLSIYSFHMPVFIIISGALSKIYASKKQHNKNLMALATPFLVFTALYEIFNIICLKSISGYTLNWQPYWILWFLFSTLIWKVILPVTMKLKFPLLVTVGISLSAGYFNNIDHSLGISRTIYFFPFFIIGYKLGPSLLSNKPLIKIPKYLYIFIIIINIIIFWLFKEIPHQILHGSLSYEQLGNKEWYSFITRSILYLISLLSSAAILMLIPSKKTWLSKHGKNTFFVYVWHGFIVKIVIYLGLIQYLSQISTPLVLIFSFISAILITFALSSLFVRSITKKLLILPIQKLLLIRI